MNIYTQFGDLTASQMLTLFSQFRKWPEYKDSSFLASFENSMLKMETSAEESVESIAEDDDNDDVPVEEQTIPEEQNSSTVNNAETVVSSTTTTIVEEKTKRSKKIKDDK